MRNFLIATGAVFFLGHAPLAGAAEVTYVVVASKSSFRIHVGKAGLFSFAGHRHEVEASPSGTVTTDASSLAASSVDLIFASALLRVLPDREPKGDAPKVEEMMHGPQVLDVVRFPEIHFRSKKVAGRALAGGSYELNLEGELSLRGMARQITVRVHVTADERSLIATGQTTLRHDQFGMKPVTAVGGTVKVANDIPIDFKIVAEQKVRRGEPASAR